MRVRYGTRKDLRGDIFSVKRGVKLVCIEAPVIPWRSVELLRSPIPANEFQEVRYG